jgi:hypothetical protein
MTDPIIPNFESFSLAYKEFLDFMETQYGMKLTTQESINIISKAYKVILVTPTKIYFNEK